MEQIGNGLNLMLMMINESCSFLSENKSLPDEEVFKMNGIKIYCVNGRFCAIFVLQTCYNMGGYLT